MSLTDRLHALDRRQQRSPRLGFVVAVVKKFSDDQAGQLAALISYYAFVSLFPLLLVFVTILGFVLQGDPGEQHKILDGTLGQVPIIRDQLKLHSLTGSTVALVIGIVLVAARRHGHHERHPERAQPHLGRAVQAPSRLPALASSQPRHARDPGHALDRLGGRRRLRRLLEPPGADGRRGRAGGVRVQPRPVHARLQTADSRAIYPGASCCRAWSSASVFWQLLQHLGGYYVDHELKRLSPLYGVFALVLGLLAWLYLGAQLTIFAAEVNVVRAPPPVAAQLLQPPARRRQARAQRSPRRPRSAFTSRTSRSASTSPRRARRRPAPVPPAAVCTDRGSGVRRPCHPLFSAL